MRVLKLPRLLPVLTCPFGISTAPGEYRSRMAHQIFQEFYLNGAVVYIDDTVIYGTNFPGKIGPSIGKNGKIQCLAKTQDFVWNGFCQIFGPYFRRKRYYDE